MKLTVTAPGKLVILGEYAVLKGAPALVAAYNRQARVTIQTLPPGESRLTSPVFKIDKLPFTLNPVSGIQYGKSDSEELEKPLKFFTETLNFFNHLLFPSGKQLPAMEIELDTSAFFQPMSEVKLGLGSSAALTVALIAALAKITGFETEPGDLYRYAREIHYRAQGKSGSGIDIAASVFGGILEYQAAAPAEDFSARTEPRKMPPGLFLLPIWTGQSASTTKLIQKIEAFERKNPKSCDSIFSALRETARKGCHAFACAHTENFLRQIKHYQDCLIELDSAAQAGIYSAAHREISRLVTDCGGIYKISGAGGGDFGLAFSTDPEIIQNIKARLNDTQFSIFDFDICSTGIKFEFP